MDRPVVAARSSRRDPNMLAPIDNESLGPIGRSLTIRASSRKARYEKRLGIANRRRFERRSVLRPLVHVGWRPMRESRRSNSLADNWLKRVRCPVR